MQLCGFRQELVFRDISPIMENQMENERVSGLLSRFKSNEWGPLGFGTSACSTGFG